MLGNLLGKTKRTDTSSCELVSQQDGTFVHGTGVRVAPRPSKSNLSHNSESFDKHHPRTDSVAVVALITRCKGETNYSNSKILFENF